ncbi:MAG: MmgE/PrpD family protein [Acidobacteria bacterium]|nr:MAG: MmgE/PrpD family protein [Acidobacteriota bacterium]PYV75896.1 MAG: MmgE/PrpD family protein [Acidobacteriota bacterium]
MRSSDPRRRNNEVNTEACTDVEFGAGQLNLTRRSLLQNSAWIAAASVFPGLALAATHDVSPVMEKLSAYMAEARNRALPDNIVQETEHHILDTIAAMVSGADLPPGRMAVEFARSYGGEKIATVVASNILCGPIEAALANGELAHSDETDDDFTTGGAHPGCAVVPAALAAGEQFGVSGTHFLRAVTLGYDIALRAMRTVGPGMKETHNLVGTMGATAAAGCTAGLNAQQMRWLLDYAAQQAGAGIGAWRRDTEHIEKGFLFGAMGARNGVNAALMVHSGWTGVDDILSGPNNFVESYNPKADAAGMIDQLGEVYGVSLTTLKKWTTGGPIQAPLDALENLQKRHPFQADQVKQAIVRVATSAAYTVNNRDMPDICLQHLVAVMLLDKTVSFRAAHDKPRMQDASVLRERAKVQLVPDAELEKLIPVRVAVVELTLLDGTQRSERVEHVRGTPENPMTRDEVVAKARELMAPVLGAQTCSKLIERVLALDIVKDIRELRPLLHRT